MNQPWLQNFGPLGVPFLSTIAAAVPVCTLFYFLAVRRTVAWRAALYAFFAALVVALAIFRMPAHMVAGAVADGLVFGWFRIAWVVVAPVFVYDVCVESGKFEIVKQSVGGISNDRRLQVLLIAFAFGALLEGAGGGGAPVAITGAMMIGMGFPPFQTAVMCLIANSAPVAYGGLGNPVRTLVAVTGLAEADFSAMLGRILPLTTLILPSWLPFILLTAFVILWGQPPVAKFLDQYSWKQPVPGLHLQVVRMPPVTLKPFAEPALFDISWLSTPGTGIFIAGLVAGPLVGLSFKRTVQVFFRAVWGLRWSLIAIMAMLGLGCLTRYCGMDATMGMAMAQTGVLFPFFGTMIGWLGVALSGTDAGSNALFGSLQVIAANKLGLSPILMGAANSAGGVMGKMVAAQSLVIGCAVTGQEGKEGELFRAVLKHSIGLLAIVGLIVLMYAYVFPQAVPSGHRYW